MAWWCLSLAALAGTPTPVWTMPVSGTIIPRGVTAGDFDADGVTDFAAVVAVSAADFRLAYTVTGTYDEVLPLVDPLPFRLDALDLDQDGRDSIALHDPDDEKAGTLFLLAPAETAPKDPKPAIALLLEGIDGSRLAADLAVVPPSKGAQDILLGVPGLDAVVRVAGTLTGDHQLNELELDQWQGPVQAELRGFGVGVAVRERGGAPEAVIARCAVEAGACANAALAVRPLSELDGTVQLAGGDLIAAPSVPLRSLERLDDVDGDGVDEVVWVGDGEKIVLSSGDASVLATISADGDDAVTNTGQGGGQLWVQDDGVVYVIDRFRASGTAAERAADAFALDGAALGLAIADAGDQDGDGCDDLIATAADTETVYLLLSPCTEPDAGDTGDTGDTADTGAPDSGDTADTGARCAPGLGWACGGSSLAAAWVGLAGLLWRRQRTQTVKRYR